MRKRNTFCFPLKDVTIFIIIGSALRPDAHNTINYSHTHVCVRKYAFMFIKGALGITDGICKYKSMAHFRLQLGDVLLLLSLCPV